MQFQLRVLAGALLLGSAVVAAPADISKGRDHDRDHDQGHHDNGVGHCKPNFKTRPTLQALNYNDLGPANNGTAAVLIHDRLACADAEKECAALGESLFPLQSAPEANRTELNYQLDYLVFADDLQRDNKLWVSKGDSSTECLAYSIHSQRIVPVPCDSKLPSLCSSTVPPTTDLDRKARDSSKLTIPVDRYSITGYRDARSFRFLRLPFANPPVDNLRFAPPQRYSGPKEIDATISAESCIQSESSFGTLGNGGISEDCLFLNVFTPVVPGDDKHAVKPKPVAVYFYGGAFTKGSSAMIDYDGGNLASRNDVVVVTVNYRVGALGWLATGNLTTGSYGTRDQILALEWIQSHIAAFGGDPAHVTIFGQSAGGQSVVALLSSTVAKGLFSGAIVQSAPVDLPWFTRDVYRDLIAPEIAKAVDCDDSADDEAALLACLRSVPASAFLDNSTDFKSAMSTASKAVAESFLHTNDLLASIEPLMPMVDDNGSGVIDAQFDVLLRTNRLPSRVPTMFTTVTDEAGLYVGRFVPSLGATQAGLNALFNIAYPPDLAKALISSDVFPLNRSDPDNVRNIGGEVLTHSEWTCAQAHLLRQAANSSFPVLYEVEITDGHVQTTVDVPEVCSPNGDYNATCHSADVLPIWGTLNSKTENVDPYYSTDDIRHSQLLDDVFGAFFRTRNPNPDVSFLAVRGPAYASTHDIFATQKYVMPPYRPDEKSLSLLSLPPGTAQNPGLTDKCAVFEDYGYTFQHAAYTP
ncbi:hypothetical protein FE257_000149 [Aspergillus nanangensis]|uniref:Carboxylesterase type B domain-containing protein n=1 Tax=Aspergillus nanangensis TaxID=2582783 RepID=A0AAD4D0V3_ASPNN|nr:hypothetical protein FE257_000149 [Aspergillus nanangensis]